MTPVTHSECAILFICSCAHKICKRHSPDLLGFPFCKCQSDFSTSSTHHPQAAIKMCTRLIEQLFQLNLWFFWEAGVSNIALSKQSWCMDASQRYVPCIRNYEYSTSMIFLGDSTHSDQISHSNDVLENKTRSKVICMRISILIGRPSKYTQCLFAENPEGEGELNNWVRTNWGQLELQNPNSPENHDHVARCRSRTYL